MINMALSREDWRIVLASLENSAGQDDPAAHPNRDWGNDCERVADTIEGQIGGLIR